MKVHLIKKQTIEDYVANNSQSRSAFEHWLGLIKVANWETPADIKSTFATADILGQGSQRIVFDIGGNKYRMICKYHFGKNQAHLFVMWIGTHAEHDKLCKGGGQYSVSKY